MLNSKTLLIVGAGASKEAGLPLGFELMPKVLEASKIEMRDFGPANADKELLTALSANENALNRSINTTINHYAKSYDRMKEGLKLSYSIDNYLDAHQDDELVVTLGKLGIVRSILSAENKSKLHLDDHNYTDVSRLNGTWYSEIFKMMNEAVSKQNSDKFFSHIEIICFNYDRCIEHFFLRSLMSYYSLMEEGASKIVSNLKIHHPYGRVGFLPWQSPNQSTVFGAPRVGGSELVRLAAQIKTFTEQQDNSRLISEMQLAVEHAETIVFLGFAFHPQNLELIAPRKSARAKRVFATACGMSKSDIEATRVDIAKWLKRESFLNTEIGDYTCAQLFSEYRRSIPR
ncbi:MAG: hypothetical protein K2Z25_24005 [Beijerinckiaceae bacterium]|nr:hypothetical protein [Beijerinckiaceae bacterium]